MIDFKETEKYKTPEILDYLLPVIDNIYKKYEYLEIPQEDYYKSILKIIDSSRKSYDGKVAYEEYLKKQILMEMSKEVKKRLRDSKTLNEVINNYININFAPVDNYKDALKNLYGLNNFFGKHDYLPDIKLLRDLFNKNDAFSSTIDLVFKHYRVEVCKGNSDKIFGSDAITSMMETYCRLNNIEIKDSYEEIGDTRVSNSVTMYLNEIGQIPLLSLEEEKVVARQVALGDEKARELLINSNLRLVVSVAKKFTNMGVPFLDLIQYGNEGLIKAVQLYDVNKGYKFSTYATSLVKQAIIKGVSNSDMIIRLPLSMKKRVNKLVKVKNKLGMELGREPTDKEVAAIMGISVDKVREALELPSTFSINMTVNEDGNCEMGDLIPDENVDVEETVIAREMGPKFKEAFENSDLTDREKYVLIFRYGLDGNDPKTMEEIGKKFNVTRERIAQIEQKALGKLRLGSFADYRSYINDDDSLGERKKNSQEIIVDKAGTKLNNGKGRSFYQRVYRKKQLIDMSISVLDDSEKTFIDRVHRGNLSNSVIDLNHNNRIRYFNIIAKVRDNCDRLESNNMEYDTNLIKVQNKFSKKTFYERVGFGEKIVERALSGLSEQEQIFINRVYSNGFDNCSGSLDLDEFGIVSSIILKMKRYCNQLVKGKPIKVKKTFYERIGSSRELVLEALNKLKEEDREFIYRVYNNDLSNAVIDLNDAERGRLSSIVAKVKRNINVSKKPITSRSSKGKCSVKKKTFI